MDHPLPAGTRVHHRAGIYSLGAGSGGPYWATIISIHSGPYPDGSYEYTVEKDAPHFEGGSTRSEWASYQIDEANRELTYRG